ncbi:transposase DNA binding site ISRme12 [Cupriavidus metallidurans CH34]|uniref:Transposase DNA binding site ISRme12 n=1 Tax=Cupriavidus metallidurans (strain ATCC 43123 / DSM 2839 / NBRC 102507 / CH34) TaxID=266264 RepID=Q1LN30_CUPMC|nr:transposase DNA binding site ISRme12 [Cupriavidus metallidurans CH34]
MAKYDESFKRQVVERYLTGSSGFKALGKELGVDPGAIRRWVGSYAHHGAAGLRKKSVRYGAKFKLSVLRRMWRDELSYRQVAALFDLRGGTAVVSAWERQYHSQGIDALAPKPRGRTKTMSAPIPPKPPASNVKETRTLEDLRKENEYLRAEVAYLKKWNALVQAKKAAAQKKRG